MHCIDGQWIAGTGARFTSTNPATEEVLWQANAASDDDVAAAFVSAATAQTEWNALGWEKRAGYLKRFAELAAAKSDFLANTIADEVGKALWDATTEAKAVAAKCDVTIDAYQKLRDTTQFTNAKMSGRVGYRPLGVTAVIGPFNFPAHVANGQIMPALLAGNTVVFKPSELSPLVAEETVKLWHEAGLPPGVLNLVQGAVPTSQAILRQPQLRGLFFTGSRITGGKIREALAQRLEVLLALELGGNNPLIAHQVSDLDQAVDTIIKSAFMTSGQRCTCTRRLIVTGDSQPLLDKLIEQTEAVAIGLPRDPSNPFMGPLIHAAAVDKVLNVQQRMLADGGVSLVEAKRLPQGNAFVSPGIIDVTDSSGRTDEETFGPLLQVIRVDDLSAAIHEANNTQYGLAAGILCDDRVDFDRFRNEVRAGLLNWNLPTTGASGQLPFGGVGQSGNYRPAGYHAINFCHVPVAEVEAVPAEGNA